MAKARQAAAREAKREQPKWLKLARGKATRALLVHELSYRAEFKRPRIRFSEEHHFPDAKAKNLVAAQVLAAWHAEKFRPVSDEAFAKRWSESTFIGWIGPFPEKESAARSLQALARLCYRVSVRQRIAEIFTGRGTR